MIDRHAARNRVNPGRELAATLEVCHRPKNSQKRFLRQIFNNPAVPGRTPDDSPDHAGIIIHEAHTGFLVAGQDLIHQHLFAIIHWDHLAKQMKYRERE
jgi:hypothetical protein